MFPSEKIVFLPSVEKTTIFSSGNKSSPQSFSVPGIKFPPRRNIYSPREGNPGNVLLTSRKRLQYFISDGGVSSVTFLFRFPFQLYCELVSSGISSPNSSKYSELVSSDVLSQNLKRDRTRIGLSF